ncbi:M81 family metallopeptidase [Gymnodinialimonas hymeniacidonis]|uniref:M81 family metallopeptidase n=1 Tax=Gymnodinialimonas hymeniacidonis TaxID=3126508 RepID=UPI0034C6B645
MSKPRIAIAGFQHETNSFSHLSADLPEFEMADSWPPFLRGEEVITQTHGMNLPIAGFVAAAEANLHPILWCAAEPSGPVTDRAFDNICAEILDSIPADIDALYLDLHGAMIAEGIPDGEDELLRRIRTQVGPNLPIVISLDLHANVSPELVEHASAITMYRTYPHLDMADAGARAYRALTQILQGHGPAKAFRQIPYIIPMHAQFTGATPAGPLYAAVAAYDATGQWAEFATGFSGGDCPSTGASVIAYAPSQTDADRIADDLFAQVIAAETEFNQPLPSPAEAVQRAMSLPTGKPVVLADVQDNPGGGGSSDTTGLLRALVSERAQNAMHGVLHDPQAATIAHKAGVGAELTLGLGGKSGQFGDEPFETTCTVAALSDGEVVYEGAMYGGGTAQIGPTALLHLTEGGADVKVVVSSVRNQCLDLAYFRHIGLTPEKARIIAVKSTVHFRADFDPIARATIPVASPGALGCLLTEVPYKHLRKGVRIGPNGPPA